MSRLSKVVKIFLKNPPEARFEDVQTVLKAFEYKEVRSEGSHHTFENEPGDKITIPKAGGKTVKRVYIKQVIKLLNLEDWQGE
jgi:predicted RNA binding protein YcfA (HicA-like mRNA interferase family)